MDIDTFITQVSTGEANAAKETLNDILSSRAFDALEAKKKEMSSSVFNGAEETEEVDNTVDAEVEETQE